MGQRWMRWMVVGCVLGLASRARATPPESPAACDPGVTASALGPAWLMDMPDLMCAWNASHNTTATGLHDHGCFDGYACDLQSRSYTFGGLTSATDGQLRYCSDCTATNPCASGGDGVIARRENGAWHCSGGAAPVVRHQLSWFFAGTPSAAVQPVRALAHAGGTGTCTLTGAEISTNTTASTNTTWNIQRCADGTCTSPTNVFTSDSTLNSGAQRYYPAPNTTTVAVGDAFRVKFVTVGTGLADVAVALTYECDE